jgi:predicted ribosome quality control (RQC) complex YloA/Tae2 family protein
MAAPALQAMDLTSLRAVLWELRPALLPSRFEKAQQPDAHSLQLGFRTLERRLWLELSWQAEAPRLMAIEAPPKLGAGSTLAQQLQHGLSGLALTELRQEGWERVVELRFAPRPGEPAQRTLVLELMGRHSNLFLLDPEQRVVAMARQVRLNQSRLRPISTGDLYSAPPALSGSPPDRQESFARWQQQLLLLPVTLKQALQSAYQGISPALALQLAGETPAEANALLGQAVEAISPHDWDRLWQRWQRWLSCLDQEQFCFELGPVSAYCCWPRQSETPAPGQGSDLAINRALAGHLQGTLQARQLQQRLHSLRQKLEQALGRERQQLQQQQDLLQQVDGSAELQREADALLCLPDPSREQVSEAQKLYKKARKLRRSVAAISPRIAQHEGQIHQLEESLLFLELLAGSSGPIPDLLEQAHQLEDDSAVLLQRQPLSRRERRRVGESPQPLTLLTPGGLTVQVGRNHRQNEWISLQQARKGDLWFHAQECPGSHVVLKSSAAAPDEQDLQSAANLAAFFSRARGNARVAVVMTACEALQRIPGAGPGTVRHRGGEVLWADPQQASSLVLAAAPNLSGAVES